MGSVSNTLYNNTVAVPVGTRTRTTTTTTTPLKPCCCIKPKPVSLSSSFVQQRQQQPTRLKVLNNKKPIKPIIKSCDESLSEKVTFKLVELYARVLTDPYMKLVSLFTDKLNFQIVNFTLVIHDDERGSINNKLEQIIDQGRHRISLHDSHHSYSRLLAECTKCLLECQDRWVCSRSLVTYNNYGKLYDYREELIFPKDPSSTSRFIEFWYLQVWRRYVTYDKTIRTREDFKQFLKQLNTRGSEILGNYAICLGIVEEDKLEALQGYSHLTIGDDDDDDDALS